MNLNSIGKICNYAKGRVSAAVVFAALFGVFSQACGVPERQADAGPVPLTTATQPMTQQSMGVAISAPAGEDALWATGEHGIVATGVTYEGVVGVGAPGAAGAWFRSGTPPTSTEPQVGIWSTGTIKFQDTPAPASSVPIANAVTPGNIINAHGLIAAFRGVAPSVRDGFNLGDVSVVPYGSSLALRVSFASPMANTNYTAIVTMSAAGGLLAAGNAVVAPLSRTTTTFDIALFGATGDQLSVAAHDVEYSIIVIGRQ